MPIKEPKEAIIVDDEYSLKQNLFDPSKASPPNSFMLNLHMRMLRYNMLKNEFNCVKE